MQFPACTLNLAETDLLGAPWGADLRCRQAEVWADCDLELELDALRASALTSDLCAIDRACTPGAGAASRASAAPANDRSPVATQAAPGLPSPSARPAPSQRRSGRWCGLAGCLRFGVGPCLAARQGHALAGYAPGPVAGPGPAGRLPLSGRAPAQHSTCTSAAQTNRASSHAHTTALERPRTPSSRRACASSAGCTHTPHALAGCHPPPPAALRGSQSMHPAHCHHHTPHTHHTQHTTAAPLPRGANCLTLQHAAHTAAINWSKSCPHP